MKIFSFISIAVAVICVLTSVFLGVINKEAYIGYPLIVAGIGAWSFLLIRLIQWRRQSYLR